jgi:hypothetical protein
MENVAKFLGPGHTGKKVTEGEDRAPGLCYHKVQQQVQGHEPLFPGNTSLSFPPPTLPSHAGGANLMQATLSEVAPGEDKDPSRCDCNLKLIMG